jgi:ketosteroid isomerase-like protein
VNAPIRPDDHQRAVPPVTDDAQDTTARTRAFLEDRFRRLSDTGFDGQVFLAALADDVVRTATGHSPVSGTFRGKQEYADGVYRRLDERLETWPRPRVQRMAMSTEVGPGVTVLVGSRGGGARGAG